MLSSMHYPKKSEARRHEWTDPEIRARRIKGLSEALTRKYEDPAERAKAAARRSEALQDPTIREANAEVLKKARAARGLGKALGMSRSPEYGAWDAMVQRCTNPNGPQWKDYGGRGICVTPEWVGPGGFARFFSYVGKRPTPKHTIGRIENNGNYEPGNVRWETRLEQMANFRRNHPVTIAGLTLHLTEWARRIGVTAPCLEYRIKHWPESRWTELPNK